MTQTIKEYLAKAIEKNDRLCKLGNGDMDGNSNGNVIAQDIRLYLSAIEAKLNAPMKSAEEWVMAFQEHSGFGDFGCKGCLNIIRAIQADAIASRLPDVDLRNLAEETALDIDQQVVL